MPTILAPTRGGKRSYPNQDRAIALAKERGAKLVFLYISDVQFLNQVASPTLLDVASDELEEMGEFLLTMAKERADAAGTRAETLVKSGVFREVLQEVIPEFEVDTLVLGTSQEEAGLTSPQYMRELSADLAKSLGIEVVLLLDGEIVETIAA